MNLEDLDLSPKSVDFEIVRLQIGRFSPSLQSGFNFLPFPPDYLDDSNRPDCSTDRTLGNYFLNPRKKDADQDEIEEKLIPVKVTVPDEPVRKVSSRLTSMTHCYDSFIWVTK